MVRFSKYTGAGNDFVIAVPGPHLDRNGSAAARRYCSRREGAGVDGLILVYPDDQPETVRVRFFNPDGSEFSTCGNGSRCAASFAAHQGLVGPEMFTLVTSAGPISASVDEDRVSLEYILPAHRRGPITVEGPHGPLILCFPWITSRKVRSKRCVVRSATIHNSAPMGPM